MIKFEKPFVILALAGIIVGTACAQTARAQGSRKDDIVFNAQGRPMAGATVRICTSAATGQPCSPLASIYSDTALTQALANPLSADGLGNYTFYASPGRYMIEISGPGITTKQLPNVILPSDPSTPTFTTVTTTSGISAFSLSLSGNLTVSGSTSVSGSLTVGGAPVPSTNADNQWSAAQRFKGPIPYRDFTAYMPAGGCSSTSAADPDTTGTITSGQPTLTLASAIDFKNGCGITILHAGPTSALVMPSTATCSAANSSGTITFTCPGGHLLDVNSNTFGGDQGVTTSGCSDATFDTTTGIQTIASTTTFTISLGGTGASATGCTAHFLLGWAHGVTGSTTYYYKVSACETGGGCSAAVGPVTITNGPATINGLGWNWIGWPIVDNATGVAKLACVYRSTDNVTYAAVGTSLTMGFSDHGGTFPVFPGCPSTPPASPTADQLTTTIVSGAGTTTLTLAANASNNASGQNVYHDETSFLNACVQDVAAFESGGAPGNNGEFGCLVPAGSWHFNSDAVSDTNNFNNAQIRSMKITFQGAVVMKTWPWAITSGGWSLIGDGANGGQAGSTHFPTVGVLTGANVSDVFMVGSNTTVIHGFSMLTLRGNGIHMEPWIGADYAVAGLNLQDIIMQESGEVRTEFPWCSIATRSTCTRRT